jgi:hypothetical protein
MEPAEAPTASEEWCRMTEKQPPDGGLRPLSQQEFEFGGLRFDVSFRGNAGATLRVDGKVKGQWKEMLRFDDFVDAPHYHAPADADQINFDRATYGDPLEWYMTQIRDDLPEWLEKSGFADVVPTVDMTEVIANLGKVRDAMDTCVPEGFTRVPGIGLQRVPAKAESSKP